MAGICIVENWRLLGTPGVFVCFKCNLNEIKLLHILVFMTYINKVTNRGKQKGKLQHEALTESEKKGPYL